MFFLSFFLWDGLIAELVHDLGFCLLWKHFVNPGHYAAGGSDGGLLGGGLFGGLALNAFPAYRCVAWAARCAACQNVMLSTLGVKTGR